MKSLDHLKKFAEYRDDHDEADVMEKTKKMVKKEQDQEKPQVISEEQKEKQRHKQRIAADKAAKVSDLQKQNDDLQAEMKAMKEDYEKTILGLKAELTAKDEQISAYRNGFLHTVTTKVHNEDDSPTQQQPPDSPSKPQVSPSRKRKSVVHDP